MNIAARWPLQSVSCSAAAAGSTLHNVPLVPTAMPSPPSGAPGATMSEYAARAGKNGLPSACKYRRTWRNPAEGAACAADTAVTPSPLPSSSAPRRVRPIIRPDRNSYSPASTVRCDSLHICRTGVVSRISSRRASFPSMLRAASAIASMLPNRDPSARRLIRAGDEAENRDAQAAQVAGRPPGSGGPRHRNASTPVGSHHIGISRCGDDI